MGLKIIDQDTASVVISSVDIRVGRDEDPMETYTGPSTLYGMMCEIGPILWKVN
jgi:hypothetical protein